MVECNGKSPVNVADCLPFLQEDHLLASEAWVTCYGSVESCLGILAHMGEIVFFRGRRYIPYSSATFSILSNKVTLDSPSQVSGITSLSTSKGLDMR